MNVQRWQSVSLSTSSQILDLSRVTTTPLFSIPSLAASDGVRCFGPRATPAALPPLLGGKYRIRDARSQPHPRVARDREHCARPVTSATTADNAVAPSTRMRRPSGKANVDALYQWWTSSRHSIPPSERRNRTDTFPLDGTHLGFRRYGW